MSVHLLKFEMAAAPLASALFTENTLLNLLYLGGIGHIFLALGSAFIPRVLQWPEKLASSHPQIRQMFWTYAGYIFGIHLFFGIISIVAASDLLSGSILAIGMHLFISLYWLIRIILQYTIYDKTDVPHHWKFSLGEFILIAGFSFFTLLYGYLAFYNLQ